MVVHQMTVQARLELESKGFKITIKKDKRNRQLYTYVYHPLDNQNDPARGLDVKYFTSLGDVTHYDVEHGEYFDICYYNWPVEDCPPFPHDDLLEGYNAEVEEWYESSYNAEGLPVWWMWCLIAYAVAISAFVVVTMIAFLLERINDPCPYEEHWINSCWKAIRVACKWAEFNTCGGPDVNGDGIPDGQWEGAPPGESGEPDWKSSINLLDYIMWGTIAVVVIGAVYIAVKIIPSKRYQPPPEVK